MRYYDWGDSVVAHPFAAMLVPLGLVRRGPGDAGLRRARDAYLDVFADRAPRDELAETLALACRVATIARALTWHRALQAARDQGEPVDPEWATAPLETLATLLDEDTGTMTAVTRILAQLSVRRGREAIEFYKAAFGAVEDYRVGGTDDYAEVVAQLSVGDASFWVADESPEHRNFSPESVGGATVRMLLVVEDPDAAIARAVAAGATLVAAASDEHGWRLGRIADPFGHDWEIGKPLIPWPPS